MESSPRVITQTPSPRSLSSTHSSTVTNNNGSNCNLPIARSEPNNPYPATFVQADTTSFKKVVQMLTGSQETVNRRQDPTRNSNPIPAFKPGPIRKDQHKSASKLYERRNSFKNFKMISPMGHARPGVVNSGWIRPGMPEVLSPSLLDFPSLVLSPVTPLIPDPFKRAGSGFDAEAEEKAIKEKGFYLHPSPRDSEPPRLLPLFPVTSPTHEGSSLSSSSDHENGAAKT